MTKQVIEDTSGALKPQFVVVDAGQLGTLVPGGQNIAGFAATALHNPTNGPIIFALLVRDDSDTVSNGQCANFRIYARGNSVGGADAGYEVWWARGTMADPTGALQGDRLAVFRGFACGRNTTGGPSDFIPDEVGSFNVGLDQDATFTPGSGDDGKASLTNSKAGGTVYVLTTDKDSDHQRLRWVADSKGNFAVGEWLEGGNNFPATGSLVIKDASAPSAQLANAGMLTSVSGEAFWSDHGRNRPMLPRTCQWNASGTLVKSFGVDSVTKNGTGDFTISFPSFADADSFAPMFFGQGHYAYAGRSAGSIRVQSFDANGQFKDFDVNYMTAFG